MSVSPPKLYPGILLITSGLVLIILGGVAQLSSIFTPSLASYPVVLNFFGNLGADLILLGVIIGLCYSIMRKRSVFYLLSLIFMAEFLVVELNDWGRVFQLALAGLSLGGGLILLGCLPRSKITRLN